MSKDKYKEAFGLWPAILPGQAMETGLCLRQRARDARRQGEIVYPADEDIFRALLLTPPESVKAVILGQDPYHGPGQACGLSFSVQPGCKLPPSLRNIYNELQSDIACLPPANGDLTHWAKSGVLLLNTVLTVSDGKANSHVDWGWQDFTKSVLRAIIRLPQPVVFILWGAEARAASCFVPTNDPTKATLWSAHPSPLSAYRGFLGSHPFSQANHFLRAMGATPIDWSLPTE